MSILQEAPPTEPVPTTEQPVPTTEQPVPETAVGPIPEALPVVPVSTTIGEVTTSTAGVEVVFKAGCQTPFDDPNVEGDRNGWDMNGTNGWDVIGAKDTMLRTTFEPTPAQPVLEQDPTMYAPFSINTKEVIATVDGVEYTIKMPNTGVCAEEPVQTTTTILATTTTEAKRPTTTAVRETTTTGAPGTTEPTSDTTPQNPSTTVARTTIVPNSSTTFGTSIIQERKLPQTGGDIVVPVGTGAALGLAGLALLVTSRRNRKNSPA
jgi:LPXTG-motif cell wall-anchored protein